MSFAGARLCTATEGVRKANQAAGDSNYRSATRIFPEEKSWLAGSLPDAATHDLLLPVLLVQVYSVPQRQRLSPLCLMCIKQMHRATLWQWFPLMNYARKQQQTCRRVPMYMLDPSKWQSWTRSATIM